MRFFLLVVIVSCVWLYFAKTNNSITMKIRRIRLEPKSKLSGRNLSWANLEGIDLSGSDMSNANLEGAKLNGSDLSGVNLESANLSQAQLIGTNLSEANLTNCEMYGASFTSGFAEFGKVTRQAALSNVDLREAKLVATNFSWGQFEGLNFSHSDLRRADFCSANLRSAKLANANLGHARLSHADCTDVDLRWANLEEADLSNTIFTRANFSKANLTGAKLMSASFYKADFSGAITNGLKIYEDQLDGMLNVDLSLVEVYDRKSNKKISTKNSSQRKDKDRTLGERYVPLPAPTPIQVAKNSKGNSFQTQESELLLQVRKEVDEFVKEIHRIRGSDTAIAFASPTEIQHILNSIQEITDRALARAGHFFEVVRNDLLTHDKEEIMNQIGREFERVTRATGHRG